MNSDFNPLPWRSIPPGQPCSATRKARWLPDRKTVVAVWMLWSIAVLPALCLDSKSDTLFVRAPDSLRLYGILTLPDSGTAFPVVLFIPGSGPVDRDGNIANLPGKNNSFQMLAEALRQHGIATLRYDKRGIGKSRGKNFHEDSVLLSHFVQDVITWVQWLRKDGRFSHIFLLGHSQGGLIALLVAQRIPVDGLILVAPQPLPMDSLLIQQLQQRAPFLLPQARQILAALRAGESVDSIPPLLLSLFRPSVQPFLRSWLQYDPRKEIQKVAIPIAIFCGSTDIQVRCEDVAALAQYGKQVQYTVISGMNHLMKRIETKDVLKQQQTFFDPTIPLASELPRRIALFVHATAGNHH